MILKRSTSNYSRKDVKAQREKMFIFTDNCDRTSGRRKVADSSEYSIRFNKKSLCYPAVTSALIRGIDNAYPITTMKFFDKAHRLEQQSQCRWNDDDFEEFKKTIDDDFEYIKQACIKKGYKEIIFPSNGILNTGIAQITFNRTPKLFNYIIEKELELQKFNPENYKEDESN